MRFDSHTSFKVKKSKIRVTRPINADTHRAPYLLNGKVYELQTWLRGWRTTTRISHRRHEPMTSKVKSQGHKLTLTVRLISASSLFGKQNVVPVSLEAGGGIPCRLNPAATLLVTVCFSCVIFEQVNEDDDDRTCMSNWNVHAVFRKAMIVYVAASDAINDVTFTVSRIQIKSRPLEKFS